MTTFNMTAADFIIQQSIATGSDYALDVDNLANAIATMAFWTMIKRDSEQGCFVVDKRVTADDVAAFAAEVVGIMRDEYFFVTDLWEEKGENYDNVVAQAVEIFERKTQTDVLIQYYNVAP